MHVHETNDLMVPPFSTVKLEVVSSLRSWICTAAVIYFKKHKNKRRISTSVQIRKQEINVGKVSVKTVFKCRVSILTVVRRPLSEAVVADSAFQKHN